MEVSAARASPLADIAEVSTVTAVALEVQPGTLRIPGDAPIGLTNTTSTMRQTLPLPGDVQPVLPVRNEKPKSLRPRRRLNQIYSISSTMNQPLPHQLLRKLAPPLPLGSSLQAAMALICWILHRLMMTMTSMISSQPPKRPPRPIHLVSHHLPQPSARIPPPSLLPRGPCREHKGRTWTALLGSLR